MDQLVGSKNSFKRAESTKSHPWWWDSHIGLKNSKWLENNLNEMDRSVKRMVRLIEEDAKRPELIGLLDEFHRIYRSLAERYENITAELRKSSDSQESADSSTTGSEFQSLSKMVNDLESELREARERLKMQLEGNAESLLTRVKSESKSVTFPAKLADQESGSWVQEHERNKLVFFEECSYSFDLEDLLNASAEVIGEGGYGITYKADVEESTTLVVTTLVVKRLKQVEAGKKEFEKQMEIIRRVGQHPSVAPLRAYYYSADVKILVYDYYPAGNLSSLLHGNLGGERMPLHWDTRVKITLGAAKGIANLHAVGGPKFSHGNINSSNVIMKQEGDVYVSDFGLTPLMVVPTAPMRGAGYRAPEVIETHKSDIYSFGVLILEMLTGKSPVHSPSGDDMIDLPRWVQSEMREKWTSEVFDVELKRFDQNIEEEMVQMLHIAMACVAQIPEVRPSMDEVVRMIEKIRVSDSSKTSVDNSKPKDSNVQTVLISLSILSALFFVWKSLT